MTSTAQKQYAVPHAKGFELLHSDLEGLDKSVAALTTAVEFYTGGTVQAAPVLAALAGINTTNRKAYHDVLSDKVDMQNAVDSRTINHCLADPIELDVCKSVTALHGKHDLFVAAGVRGEILAALKILLNDHETLSTAVGKKLDAAALVNVESPVPGITLIIGTAIADFDLVPQV